MSAKPQFTHPVRPVPRPPAGMPAQRRQAAASRPRRAPVWATEPQGPLPAGAPHVLYGVGHRGQVVQFPLTGAGAGWYYYSRPDRSAGRVRSADLLRAGKATTARRWMAADAVLYLHHEDAEARAAVFRAERTTAAGGPDAR